MSSVLLKPGQDVISCCEAETFYVSVSLVYCCLALFYMSCFSFKVDAVFMSVFAASLIISSCWTALDQNEKQELDFKGKLGEILK